MIANEIGISENNALARVENLLEHKILSHFGPMFYAACLGGAFTLAALSVPEDRFKEVTLIVNSFKQIAHNYRRIHRFNMWFVIATESKEEIQKVIDSIEEKNGVNCFKYAKRGRVLCRSLLTRLSN